MPHTYPEVHHEQKTPDLGNLGNIPQEYEHHQRLVTPGLALSLGDAYLKWYDIHRSELSITEELIQESRSFLQAEVQAGRLNIQNELGFVLLHRCDSVVFLFMNTWRNLNELWNIVYFKDLTNDGTFQPVLKEGHAPAFCVWEMAPIWHERQAWDRYLYSKRSEADKSAYLSDQLTSLV